MLPQKVEWERAEIARSFVWKEVNRLIEVQRLKPR